MGSKKVYTPEIAAKVRRLSQYYPAAEIAASLGLNEAGLTSWAYQNGITFKGTRGKKVSILVNVCETVAKRIGEEADRRKSTPTEFVKRILTLMVQENLFEAILDDEHHPVPFATKPDDVSEQRGS